MSIDMTEVRQLFFEESLESLDLMEANLLDMTVGESDKELINSIFRVAHSIKGGAGIFKFENVVHFAHIAETLLGEIRSNEQSVSQNIINTLLDTVDALRMVLIALRDEHSYDENLVNQCQVNLIQLLKKPFCEIPSAIINPPSTETIATVTQPTPPPEPVATPQKQWRIHFHPHPQIFQTGNDPLNLFMALAELGELAIHVDTGELPSLEHLNSQQCYLAWELLLTTDADKSAIEEVFEWILEESQLSIELVNPAIIETEAESIDTDSTTSPPELVPQIVIYNENNENTAELPTSENTTFTPAPVENPPLESTSITDFANQNSVSQTQEIAHDLPVTEIITSGKSTEHADEVHHRPVHTNLLANEATSIRVNIDKIDELINIVGELVITQSMLDQISQNFESNKINQLRDGLAQLERNTRELQDSIMRIRMLPISYSFNRFPRLVHDLSVTLGKKVELRLSGESTELDKTVLEKMSDPLVHLVRNALDHGIEAPEERLAKGKLEYGILSLHAYHQGGTIIIQISDDGGGIDLNKIYQKALAMNLLKPNEAVTEEQLYEFIFHAGFSTAQQVSDVSGRGVGMDVVRRNIRSLGGAIEVSSKINQGTTFTIRLPLTLAILDGQLVRVGEQIYILSLLSIIESLRLLPSQINLLAGKAEVYHLRNEYIPIVRLYRLFNIETPIRNLEDGLIVIVEGEGQKIGLFVDELLSQQQIVIKSLETNYKQVAGISGATILGDGSVALILDVIGLIKLSQQKTIHYPHVTSFPTSTNPALLN